MCVRLGKKRTMACRVQYGRHAMAHATTKISCNTPSLYAFLRASASTRLSTFDCPSALRSFISYRVIFETSQSDIYNLGVEEMKFSSNVVVLSNCYVFLLPFFRFVLICISNNMHIARRLKFARCQWLPSTGPKGLILKHCFQYYVRIAYNGCETRWS